MTALNHLTFKETINRQGVSLVDFWDNWGGFGALGLDDLAKNEQLQFAFLKIALTEAMKTVDVKVRGEVIQHFMDGCCSYSAREFKIDDETFDFTFSQEEMNKIQEGLK